MKPEGTIEPQTQTERPFPEQDYIMDDTVVLMDDTSALMGGQVVSSPNLTGIVTVVKPQGK